MADPWPDPVPGAPYTSCSMAALVLGAAARLASDFARGMVPTGPRVGPYDGLVLADALQLAELVRHVVEAAVVLEREDGTSWQEITDTFANRTHPSATAEQQLESAQHTRWADVLQRWREQVELAALREIAEPGELPDALAAPPTEIARELDAWAIRHHEAGDPDIGLQPVTAGLQEMDPLRELLHLAALRRRLAAVFPDPPGPLLAPILAREEALEAALEASSTAS
jgi:hypothetical protein